MKSSSPQALRAWILILGICLTVIGVVVQDGAIGWGPFTALVKPILCIAGITTLIMAVSQRKSLYPITGSAVVMASTIRILDAVTQDRYPLLSGPVVLTVAGWTYIGLASVVVWRNVIKDWLDKSGG